MNERDLKKRWRGLQYEAGRLPHCLIYSKWYWSLPHDLRRFLYMGLFPGSSWGIRKLRSVEPENLNAPTLKPFFDTRSIFVHIPKCAGLSITFGLYGRKTGDHRTIADYKLAFSKSEFKSFFKFAFVRNPWDRLLSAYFYMKQGGRNKQDYDWSIRYLSPYDNFDEFVLKWVNEDNIRLGLHFRPQFEFVCTKNHELEVDFIGYFENIENDYEHICNVIAIGSRLQAINKSAGKKDYRDYYNEETKSIVEHVYRADIKLFGYAF